MNFIPAKLNNVLEPRQAICLSCLSIEAAFSIAIVPIKLGNNCIFSFVFDRDDGSFYIS